MTQRDVANSVLVTLSSSAMVAPNFWLNPNNNVTYPLLVQTPQYRVNTMPELMTIPVTGTGGSGKGGDPKHLLMDVARVNRGQVPMVLSQFNIRPVVRRAGRRAGHATWRASRPTINRVVDAESSARKARPSRSMSPARSKRCAIASAGLAGGMVLAVVLVYSASGDQFPELDRPAHRAGGGAVRTGGRDVDALSHWNAHQRSGADGNADVHRIDDGEQHARGRIRQPTPATRVTSR